LLWQALWRYYFSKLISPRDCVLDLGCGYGDFINAVVAERRIGIDAWAECRLYLAPEVEAVVGSVTDLGFLSEQSVDFCLCQQPL
jgi:hypothetical protein